MGKAFGCAVSHQGEGKCSLMQGKRLEYLCLTEGLTTY